MQHKNLPLPSLMLSADWNDGKKKKKKKITICVHRCLSFHLLYARCTSAKQNKKQKSPKSLILRSRQPNWMFDCCFFSCLYLFFLTDVNIWTFFFFSPSFFSGAALLEAHALDVRERVRLSSGGYEWATAARPAGQYGQLMNEVEIIKINRPGDTTQRVPPPLTHLALQICSDAHPVHAKGHKYFFWSTSLLMHTCSDWLYFSKPKGLHSA